MGPGLRFGGLAFLAGALLGPMRELLLAPWIGGLGAAWVEATAMAVLVWLAARASLPRGQSVGGAAVAGLVALAVVLVAEAALSLAFETSGLAATRAPREPEELLPGYLLLAWVAILPLLVRRRG